MEEHDEGVLVDTTRVPYNDEEEVWVMQNLGVIPFDFFESILAGWNFRRTYSMTKF